jgi:hypothetical protein
MNYNPMTINETAHYGLIRCQRWGMINDAKDEYEIRPYTISRNPVKQSERQEVKRRIRSCRCCTIFRQFRSIIENED